MSAKLDRLDKLQHIYMHNIADVVQVVNETAREHGFVEDVCNIDQKLLLAIGELVEAQNELRNGRSPQDIYYEGNTAKPEGFGIELADAIIRIFDLAAQLGIDLQAAIAQKAIYNEGRPYKHGKSF